MQMGMRMAMRVEMSQEMLLLVGETSGDIPALSMHKIKTKLAKFPIGISRGLEAILIKHLSLQNEIYREASGNNWACLTSRNLIDAIEQMRIEVDDFIIASIKIIKEADTAKSVLGYARTGADEQIMLIQNWFHEHYVDLRYNMNGKIPWAIVMRLRLGLSVWITHKLDTFHQDVREFVMEVASDAQIQAENADDAWKNMGGKIS